jgi:hypothetical protein
MTIIVAFLAGIFAVSFSSLNFYVQGILLNNLNIPAIIREYRSPNLPAQQSNPYMAVFRLLQLPIDNILLPDFNAN